MSATNDLWMTELESIFDDFVASSNEEVARERLRRLGFDPEEIDEHMEAWKR